MASETRAGIGLVVRSGPWQGRSNRDQLDVALAAAALGFELNLYFLDDGLLQLVRERDGRSAGLPPGHKAWRSLWDLAEVRAWTTPDRLEHFEKLGVQLVCPVQAASPAQMAATQQSLSHLWML